MTSDPIDDLAFRFFKLMARYEYAMKAMGYIIEEDSQVRPDWDRFAANIGRVVLNAPDPDLGEARKYLFANPPKRQVRTKNGLAWER